MTSAMRQIPIRRNHSAVWLNRYATAYADWRKPAMTKVRPSQVATGGPSNTCAPVLNQIRSCDGSYGINGWLGLATVWTYAGGRGHIAQGTSKVNNSYFTRPQYNTIPWRQLVICQEIGHNFGIGHVNVVFGNRNVGSCMDYTNDPDGGGAYGPSNMHPYAHDYSLINSRHNHVGAAALLPGFTDDQIEAMPETTELSRASQAFNPLKLSELGRLVAVGDGGRTERYEMDFADGSRATSLVIRAK